MIPSIQHLTARGWVFKYCDAAKFIYAEHPNGGSFSLAEMRIGSVSLHGIDRQEAGNAIAEFLNSIGDDEK